MKITILIAVALASNAGAASYTLANNDGPVNTSSIVDNVGNFLTDATAAVGYFTVSDTDVQSAASTSFLTTNFVTFTNNSDGFGPVNTVSGIQGVFNVAGTGVDLTDTGSEFRTASVYLLITHNTSEEALVFKFGQTFGTTEVNASLLLTGTKTSGAGNDTPTGGTLLLGQYDVFQAEPHETVASGDVNPTFNLVQVPEPSSTVLLGLGGVAFFLRRRR